MTGSSTLGPLPGANHACGDREMIHRKRGICVCDFRVCPSARNLVKLVDFAVDCAHFLLRCTRMCVLERKSEKKV